MTIIGIAVMSVLEMQSGVHQYFMQLSHLPLTETAQ